MASENILQKLIAGEITDCDWSQLSGDDWGELLLRQPQYADRCNLKRLDNWVLYDLVKTHPQIAKCCDTELLGLLKWMEEIEPEFAAKCDKM